MELQAMKIVKNGIAREKIKRDMQKIMKVWNDPAPSTEDIIEFFRLLIEYPTVQLNVVR